MIRFFILFLTCSICVAAPPTHLTLSPVRQSPQDLEVTHLEAKGKISSPAYVSYEQLLSLSIPISTAKDPNTNQAATYVAVPFESLLKALGNKNETVIATTCYDHYKPYFWSEYIQGHHPVLVLKLNHLTPDQWPEANKSKLSPYLVSYGQFMPVKKIYGFEETALTPYGIVGIELSTYANSLATLRTTTKDPEAIKGEEIARNSCLSCHNLGNVGGQFAQRPWQVLAAFAASNHDYFRKYVTNPQQFNPQSHMPPHPTYDEKTFQALELYFKSTLPSGD